MKIQKQRRRMAGFSLLELMIVVIILAVLAVTIIPQFVGTTYDAKVSAAKGHIAELNGAVARFNVSMDRYPAQDEGLQILVNKPAGEDAAKWRGPYIDHLPNDPWGNAYQYKVPATHGTAAYEIWSRGADGADGGEGDGADIGSWTL
jgi:general secretion pathway protein G